MINNVSGLGRVGVWDFKRGKRFSGWFSLIRERGCFGVFIVGNDFGDSGFMVIGNGV